MTPLQNSKVVSNFTELLIRMKFDTHFPTERLKPYIKYFVVSENDMESEYKVFPSSGLVIGFQYKGQLATLKNNTESKLTPRRNYRNFRQLQNFQKLSKHRNHFGLLY